MNFLSSLSRLEKIKDLSGNPMGQLLATSNIVLGMMSPSSFPYNPIHAQVDTIDLQCESPLKHDVTHS
jgi:hypothetical protein